VPGLFVQQQQRQHRFDNGNDPTTATTTMGNAVGASNSPALSQEQEDLKYLGDRFPFGDAELVHLYRAFYYKRQQQRVGDDDEPLVPPDSSFFVDWAVRSVRQQETLKQQRRARLRARQKQQSPRPTTAAADDDDDELEKREREAIETLVRERENLLQVVEWRTLPAGFGNRLYERAFLAPGDVSAYGTSSATTAASSAVVEDDYTRKSRLEAFFEGISNSGRRGAKATLTVLFDTCEKHERSDGHAHSLEIVAVGYRLAMALAFLQAAENSRGGGAAGEGREQQEEEDEGEEPYAAPQDFLLDEVSRHSTASSDSADAYDVGLSRSIQKQLEGLAYSLSERGRSRRQQEGVFSYGTPASGNVDGDVDEDQLLQGGWVQLKDVVDWSDRTAPVFSTILPTFLFHIFFPGRPYPPSRTPFELPRIHEDSAFFASAQSPLLFSFACLSSSLNGRYHRLFTSESDGTSFNRLLNALLGYAGPTLLLIRDTDANVFGAFTASPWKESKEFYGNSDCFLFGLADSKMSVYRPTGKSSNYMYCNSFARSRGYDKQAHGIGFGGSVTQPRLFLSEGLDDCYALSQDLTFENGKLLLGNSSSKSFSVESLEVWAVGGDEVVQQALGARGLARQVKDEAIMKARKVDKAAFLDDFRSGAIDSKAFKYREQIDGRADQDVKDRHSYDNQKGK